MKPLLTVAATCLALLATAGADAGATSLAPIGSFDKPVYVTSDPSNPNRLFVVEREGTIERVESGVRSKFADLSAAVQCAGSCQGERGLMSVAFSPDFAQSGRLFVDYANNETGAIHIDELVAEGPSHAVVTSQRPMLTIPHAESIWHNGGQIQFGPDGSLYVSTGDGGGNNGEFHHAQDPSSALGKILRVSPSSTGEYAVWNSGLRNPFRFSFDRLNGDMVIADVGQSQSEEIDFAPSPGPKAVGGGGANYGWNCREGLVAGPPAEPDPQCPAAALTGFVDPVFDYPTHSPDPALGTGRCSIIGGYVVRDSDLGALYGRYLYGDYCSGGIRALQLPAAANGRASGDCALGPRADGLVSFGEDSAGRIYTVQEGGPVSRLVGLPSATCPLAAEARAQATPTFIGIKAQRRRVERGKAALLTVWVSPCKNRKGTSVALRSNGHRNGTKFLSRACTARFLRKIHRGTTFVATTKEKSGYQAGKSRRMKIRIAPHRRSPKR